MEKGLIVATDPSFWKIPAVKTNEMH